MRTVYQSKEQLLEAALEEVRRAAFAPIEHMNRKERRTKMGRIMQEGCERALRVMVLEILKNAEADEHE